MKVLEILMTMLMSSQTLRHAASAFSASVLNQQRQALRLVSTAGATATAYTIECPATHPDTLHRHVSKHVSTLDQYLARKPMAPHTLAAFQLADREIKLQSRESIILDSGCGTGRSSLVLGETYPNAVVLGVDRSLARLERNPYSSRPLLQPQEDQTVTDDYPLFQQVAYNVWLIRAELVDFWRCARTANLVFDKHFMLYPNPYPKQSRLQQRWYAHPSFPLLLQSSPHLVIRSNWKQYLEEMAVAAEMANQVWKCQEVASTADGNLTVSGPRQRLQEEPPWTNFEEKYQKAGERTFELELRWMTNDVDS
ncbi:hypothetical protein MPSEU_000402600 [Mayamaea pseudoterrestris]|nr:hypothetical protein MPSEU_000402600 [Mayamaea pseudoterrestris]